MTEGLLQKGRSQRAPDDVIIPLLLLIDSFRRPRLAILGQEN
jgi:hypothetical protein